MTATITRPAKPRPDFPLFPHVRGYWCKKIRGKFHYFGKIVDDPKGEAALNLWLDQRDDLHAGRTPRVPGDGLTVATLCNHLLTAKEHQRDAGEIQPRTFAEYLRVCRFLVAAFGKGRLVEDLAADDFQALRARLAKINGVNRLAVEVQRIRCIFKYGHDAGLIDKPVRFGSMFKKPAARLVRQHRQQNGVRLFEPTELRTIIEAAPQPLKAMILLGINCGFGNHDCATLPKRAVDLKAGWVTFPRPKTSIERRCPLWPETIKAIQESIDQRPKHKDHKDSELVFLTNRGTHWFTETANNPISRRFRLLLVDLKLRRPGWSFYTLRHTFETIGGDSRDQVAVNHIMGHADASMAGVYREKIEGDRLRSVTDHVHRWLFAKSEEK